MLVIAHFYLLVDDIELVLGILENDLVHIIMGNDDLIDNQVHLVDETVDIELVKIIIVLNERNRLPIEEIDDIEDVDFDDDEVEALLVIIQPEYDIELIDDEIDDVQFDVIELIDDEVDEAEIMRVVNDEIEEIE